MTKSATIWRPQSGTGDATSISDTFLITDLLSDFLVTESLDFLILEPSVVTPKASSIWGQTDTKNASAWRVDGFGDVGSKSADTRTTVLADIRVTVSGDIRVTALGTYTPKSSSVWADA